MKLSSFTNESIISSLKMLAAMPVGLAMCLLKRNKNVWLITERPDQARDNGYVFFKHLRENHPEINAYYIIQQGAPDIDKIADLGNIIYFDTWKHYVFYCLSKIHISAHTGGCCPSSAPICKHIKRFLKVKDVFIPHGVSYGVSEFCLAKYTHIDLFVCSGEPEYRNVLAHYGYTKVQLAYTGFPRLDIWHDRKVNPKQLVLMPTWRLYLAQNPDTVFDETAYFRAYDEILHSERLQRFLTDNGLKLVFYLHNEMRKYQSFFTTSCSNIEIVRDDTQYDIQELLKTSALLITDYSSVHFDFAYMDKPVLYYQFDREEFFNRQYEKGDFDAERDGFGPVCLTLPALLDHLEQAYSDGFAMSEQYHAHMRNFYQLYDNHNCDRVFQAIQERFGEK